MGITRVGLSHGVVSENAGSAVSLLGVQDFYDFAQKQV